MRAIDVAGARGGRTATDHLHRDRSWRIFSQRERYVVVVVVCRRGGEETAGQRIKGEGPRLIWVIRAVTAAECSRFGRRANKEIASASNFPPAR